MGVDVGFEQALAALLDGSPLPEENGSPLTAHLQLLRDVAALHGNLMAGETASATPGARGERWGHLELREVLGRGASATVYRAWDAKLGRDVALKLFDTASVDANAALREGQLLASVRHPHLVTVYGADVFDGLPGLWMELIHGDTIETVVSASGPWPLDAVLVAGRDLAAALATLHDRQLVHRDVKARNAIRERGGRHVLMDLGAGLDSASPLEGDVQGTPLYMAPEVLERAPATERADLYGLGVLLFFMLTGRHPIEASSMETLRERHRQGVRVRVVDVRPSIPDDIAALVDACCAPQPAARPASARVVEAECAAALARLAGASNPVPSRVERVWARVVRPLALAGAVAVGSVVGLVTAWDSQLIRDARWAVGIRTSSSPLIGTGEGRILTVDGTGLTLLRANPPGATPLAVATTDGLITTMGGTPPFEQGGLSMPLDGGLEETLPTTPEVCCFNDGTTDGFYNYAIRRDDTRNPGVRSLAPSVLYRFSRRWTNPEPLFELASGPDYLGVAYIPERDQFLVGWSPRGVPVGRLEVWTRGGRRVSVVAEVPSSLLGVAYDPADRTAWVVQATDETSGVTLLAFDLGGRPLGVRHFDESGPGLLAGLECPLPATSSLAVRLWRRLGGMIR